MTVAPLKRVGRTTITVERDSGGQTLVDGFVQDSPKTILTMIANVQPALQMNRMILLPEGDRSKQAIFVITRQELFMADEGLTQPKKADVIVWKGKRWEVKMAFHYEMGVRDHCEVIAIREDDV
jgi:hypothetical protein